MTSRRLIATLAVVIAVAATNAAAKTFRLAFQGDVQTMDPYSINETFTTGFQSAIYEPLVRRTATLEIEPGLAESWTRSSDTLWRFNLRRGVRFHEGEAFTADDVLFSFERVRKDGSTLLARVATIKALRRIDDHAIEIETDGPDPTLLANLTNILIMSRGWAEKHGASEPVNFAKKTENHAARNANGTGPFRLKSRLPDSETVLVRNAAWWDRAEHNLDEVVFTPIASDPTRVAALLSGQIDMAWPIPIQDVARVERTAGMRMMEGPEARTVFFALDVHRPELLHSTVKGRNPFADLRVRQAIYKAIDVEAIRTRVMRGRATPTNLLNGPGITGFDAELNKRTPYDPEGARRLLAEAGYANGFQFGMHCPNNRYVNDAEICQAVVAMLAQIGLQVNLTAMPSGPFFQLAARREVSFYMLGTTPPTYDAFSTIFGLLMCREDIVAGRWPTIRGQGNFNHGGFCDRRLDDAVNRARVELDAQKRHQHFAEAWRIMQESVATIPIHQQALSWGMKTGVTLKQRPDDVVDLRYVRLD